MTIASPLWALALEREDIKLRVSAYIYTDTDKLVVVDRDYVTL